MPVHVWVHKYLPKSTSTSSITQELMSTSTENSALEYTVSILIISCLL